MAGIDEAVRIWVKTYAEMQGCSEDEAIAEILKNNYDESLSLTGNLARKRQVPSPLWMRRVLALQRVQERAAAEQEERDSAREDKRQKYLNSKLKSIDFKVLERDSKLRGGYAGVYPHRERWRPFVISPGGKGKYLRTRALPELAAWDRYLWFKANDVPYGDSAKMVANMLRGGASGSDHEIIATEQEAIERWASGEIGATDSHIVYAERQARKALRDAEAAKPKLGRPPKRKEVFAARGGVMTWFDQWRLVIEHDDGTATSYQGIDEQMVGRNDRVAEGALLGYAIGAKAKVRLTPVPPPSKIVAKATPPPIVFGPTSPHYAEQQHQRKLAKEAEEHAQALAAADVTPIVPPPVLEPVPDLEDEPIAIQLERLRQEDVLGLEVAVDDEPVPPARPASIFDPGYQPPGGPKPGRFAHIRSVPMPADKLAEAVAATLAEVPFNDKG